MQVQLNLVSPSEILVAAGALLKMIWPPETGIESASGESQESVVV